MKKMSERKMDMNKGKPESSSYFPEEAEMRPLPKVGEIKGFKYPDTDQAVHSDQQEFVKDTSKNMPKAGFRH